MAEKKGARAEASDEKAAVGYHDMNAHDQAVEDAKSLSIFDLARRADIRQEAEEAQQATNARAARRMATVRQDVDEEGVPRKAGNVRTEFVETPFDMKLHPDGSAKMMVICRPNGSGEREVTVDEWDRIQANPNLAPGAWVIKYTEVIAPHHSDAV